MHARPSSERRLCQLLDRAPPYLDIAELPTPVQELGGFTIGAPSAQTRAERCELWVKRDDLTSSLYGGGKPRKLEWLLADPGQEGLPVHSIGATGSHHLLALALHLKPLGRSLHAMIFEQPVTRHVRRNFAALVSSGARLFNIPGRWAVPFGLLRYRLAKFDGPRGRYMAPGGSDALGVLGFVEAGLELAAQIAAGELPAPDVIYITAGTTGSSAGLALGLALAKVRCHLRLVAAVEAIGVNPTMFYLSLARGWASLRGYGLRAEASSQAAGDLLRQAGVSWSIELGQLGRGYGDPTAASLAAISKAQAHGLELEPTYTGKCLAAVLADAESGRLRPGQRVLFWNSHAGNDLAPHIDPNWSSRVPRGSFSSELMRPDPEANERP